MQQYKIREGGFKEIKSKLILRMVPWSLLVFCLGMVISQVNARDDESIADILPVMVPVFVVVICISLYIAIKRQKVLIESYTLTLTDNLITREQFNTAIISIHNDDIKEIIKGKKGGILIKGKDAEDQIIIFPQIERYDQLVEALNEIKPVTTKVTLLSSTKFQILLSLFTLGLMVCFFCTTNKIVTAVTGSILAIYMLWCFYKIHKSPLLDNKTKRISLWGLILVAAVICRVTLILMGFQKT